MAGALVINEWHVGYEPNAQGEYVSIQGRRPGLISWVFSLMGIMRGIRMTANVKHIQFKSIGWGGSETWVIHLKQISSCYYGYKKPWLAAIILVFILTGPCSILLGAFEQVSDMDIGMFGVAGIIPGFSIAALIGLIYYALKKTMTVAVVEVSGVVHEIVFKGSVLEGITLNEQSSAQASEIIQWLADQAQSPT